MGCSFAAPPPAPIKAARVEKFLRNVRHPTLRLCVDREQSIVTHQASAPRACKCEHFDARDGERAMRVTSSLSALAYATSGQR